MEGRAIKPETTINCTITIPKQKLHNNDVKKQNPIIPEATSPLVHKLMPLLIMRYGPANMKNIKAPIALDVVRNETRVSPSLPHSQVYVLVITAAVTKPKLITKDASIKFSIPFTLYLPCLIKND